MSAFLFVHDLFFGPWCWERILPRVRASGHLAEAIDLPGHGWNGGSRDSIGLRDYSARIANAVASFTAPVIVVAHGASGAWATQAAQAVPDRIARLIYVAGTIPISGESCADRLSTSYEMQGDFAILTARDARDLIFHDCSEDDLRQALPRLRTAPSRPLVEPVWWTSKRFGTVARDYIYCAENRMISASVQQFIAQRAKCERVAYLPCGHAPFYAYPAKLAETVVDLGRARLSSV